MLLGKIATPSTACKSGTGTLVHAVAGAGRRCAEMWESETLTGLREPRADGLRPTNSVDGACETR